MNREELLTELKELREMYLDHMEGTTLEELIKWECAFKAVDHLITLIESDEVK